MLRLLEQAAAFSCLWTRKVYWRGMLWVQRGLLGPHLSCWFRQLLWDGNESCGGLVGSVLRTLQGLRLSPPARHALSRAALSSVCAPGDHAAGHTPCHDHRARDGRCPTLPAHAAAGQDPGGASPAPAAHPGDQHGVRGDSTRPGTQQPLGSGGREKAL